MGEAAKDAMLSTTYAACRGLVAFLLQRAPTDPEVDSFMAHGESLPDFQFRMYRLLTAATKSASRRRRMLLASVLYGLPLTTMEGEDRDRIDMLVEQLTIADIDLFGAIIRLTAFNPGGGREQHPAEHHPTRRATRPSSRRRAVRIRRGADLKARSRSVLRRAA
jgi:hypothetical protein